jgi:triosephosphate isomerase
MKTRTPIIAGNWKMNTSLPEARALVEGIVAESGKYPSVEQVVCPPFLYVPAAAQVAAGSAVKVGAQNIYWEKSGAFTGECSPLMVAEFCQYVIIGHSERRQYFHETDEDVNRKVKAALDAGLHPIICVGETLDERQSEATEAVLVRQVRAGLQGIDVDERIVLAYEPIWAIGTGVAATPDMANDAIAMIRRELGAIAGQERAQAVRIQYGGSMSPANAAELMRQPEIDGGLVGGASLKAESFMSIVAQAAEAVSAP